MNVNIKISLIFGTASLLFLLLCPMAVVAQPRYDYGRIQHERLGRGVVAIRKEGKVFVSWRVLRSDSVGQPFRVYRNDSLLTPVPLTEGGSFFIDQNPLSADAVYRVEGGEVSGSFLLKQTQTFPYISIPLDTPESGVTPESRPYGYTANDASIGDVDGDGEMEIILKWEPTNSADNSRGGYTGNTLFDCYTLSGKRLWRIDMGRNIRSGAHYVPFLVYDFDGDGMAELMVKTADGTIDGTGTVIGDSTRDWRTPRMVNGQHSANNVVGRPLDGPEFLTVFSGLTGKVLCTKEYVPERGNVGAWGDQYGNRSERYLAAVAYCDGEHPSAVFCRGYYTRTVLASWRWDGKDLSQQWVFDTDSNDSLRVYAGQGNHNLRVADVDGDGCDEIIYGSMAVDNDGSGLYTTRMGHGDAMHLMPFFPDSDRMQVWDCHENRRDGSSFRDAATGKIIFQLPANFDVGRCMAADIDPINPGVEMWSSNSGGLRNVKGELVRPLAADNPDQSQRQRRNVGMSTNSAVWWDGDFLRELLDHERVMKYDWRTGGTEVLMEFDGLFNNWTKSNPCLSADILGDWREEVLVRNAESTELRLYVSTIPTEYRINSLLEDIPYRLGVAAENVGYNQPPEAGFYLGEGATNKTFLK